MQVTQREQTYPIIPTYHQEPTKAHRISNALFSLVVRVCDVFHAAIAGMFYGLLIGAGVYEFAAPEVGLEADNARLQAAQSQLHQDCMDACRQSVQQESERQLSNARIAPFLIWGVIGGAVVGSIMSVVNQIRR